MIGLCRHFQRIEGWAQVSEEEVAESLRLARQAIETDKDDPDSLWMAAVTLSIMAGEHATAADRLERALTLNSNSALAWVASGYVSIQRNLPNRAIEAFERAMRLSPLDPMQWMAKDGLAFAYLAAGRFEEAIAWAERSLREQPRHTAVIRIMAVSHAHLDRIAEARQWLGRLLDLQPGFTITGWTAGAPQFFPPHLTDLYVEGLRKAGLPEA